MADFGTKTGTGGTPIANTYDATPALTDRVPITGGRETAVQDILDTFYTGLDTATALTTVVGGTAGNAAAGRTLADLTDDMLVTAGVPAAIGAAATYVPPGTGAAARTYAGKFAEFISVADFGTLGAGGDAAIFQEAVTAHKRVYVPAGNYTLATEILLPNGAHVCGDGHFQDASSSRRTLITYTGTSGFAFKYAAPASALTFAGDFLFDHLGITAESIASLNGGGCILLGDTTLANFSAQETIGNLTIANCALSGTVNSYGAFLTKIFDANILHNSIAGHNYGLYLYGCDIADISNSNRMNSNRVHVYAKGSGTYGGQLRVNHNDLLQSALAAIIIEDIVSPNISENYIENVDTYAVDTAQTGTLDIQPYTAVVTGTGTSFLTQLANASFGGDRKNVLIRVGTEYRRVISVASDTNMTLDAAFHQYANGVSWSIVNGTGIIASQCTSISTENNRIDVTGAAGTVPRAYYYGGSGKANDGSQGNALNGLVAISSDTPTSNLFIVEGAGVNGPISSADLSAQTDYFKGNDGAPFRHSIDVVRANHILRPCIRFDSQYWFSARGTTPKLIAGGADAYGIPSVVLQTAGSGDDLSSALTEWMWNKRLVITMRAKGIGGDCTYSIYSGATSGAKTTLLGTMVFPSSVWTTVQFTTTTATPFTSASKFLTTSKDIANVYIDHLSVVAVDSWEPITGSGSPESVYTAGIGAMYLRSDGGTGTTLYIKESGTGNTGWVAK